MRRLCPFLIALLQFSVWPCCALKAGAAYAPRPSNATPAAGSTTAEEPQSLELGAGIARDLRAGETHSYIFKIEADQFIRLIVDQQGIDVRVKVFDSEDLPVVSADRPNGMRGPEAISVIARISGVYRVTVTPILKAAPPGRYEIVLKELRRGSADDSRRILAERSVFAGEVLRSDGSAATLKQAIEKFDWATREWASLGDRYEEGVAWYGLAWSYYARGEFQEAAQDFETALKFMTELNDVYGRAINSVGLAFAHFNLGEYQGALSYFSQALDLHRRLRNKRGEAIALYGIGWVQALLGHDDRALRSFLEVLPLRQVILDRPGEARTRSSIGDMYRRLGNYQEALRYLSDSLQILRETNDHYAEANTLSSIGWTYSSLSQYDRALANFNDALDLRREVGDRAGEATTLYGISRTMDSQGDSLGARDRIESALDIIESLRASGTSQELRTDYFALVQDYYEFYVDLLMRLHSRDKTAGYDAQALHASERGRCRTLLDLLRGAQAGIRQGVDPVLLERIRTVRQDLNSATARYRESLTASNASGPSSVKDADTLSRQHLEVENLTRQFQQLESQMVATSPKYAEQTQPHILTPAELQHQLDEDTLLLEYNLGRERSYVWAVSLHTIRSYELPGRARIEEAARQVYQFVVARAERRPRETDGQWHARIKHADSEYWKAAARLSTILLEPLASQPVAKRLVIVPQGALQSVPFAALPLPLPLPSASVIAQPSGMAGRHAAAGAKIEATPLILNHEVVILPSASTLACLRRYWPDRGAPTKTVAVLADPVFSADDQRVKAYFKPTNLESSGPSHHLTRQSERSTAATAVTGSSKPRSPPGSLPRLSFTRLESHEIMSMVQGNDGLEAVDFKASRALATSGELSKYRIVHFATHALIDNEHPDLSAIALSAVNERGEAQDGLLRAREIFNLKLSADLVVLSACRSGTGKDVAGEGLFGLTRPFMYAGAPAVIVSLWSLDDHATAELMRRFYEQLLGPNKLSPAAALRAAKIRMWRESRWRSPYFWGAFQLQGDWR